MSSLDDLAEVPETAGNSPNPSQTTLPLAYGPYPPWRRHAFGDKLQLTRSEPPRWSFLQELGTKDDSNRRTFHAPTLEGIHNGEKRFGLVPVYALNKYENALVFANRFPAKEARYAAAERVEASFEAFCLASSNHKVPRWALIDQIDDFCLQMIDEDHWYTFGDIFSKLDFRLCRECVAHTSIHEDFEKIHLSELLYDPGGRAIRDPADFAGYLRRFPGAHGLHWYQFWHKFYVVLGALCTTSQGVYHACKYIMDKKSIPRSETSHSSQVVIV